MLEMPVLCNIYSAWLTSEDGPSPRDSMLKAAKPGGCSCVSPLVSTMEVQGMALALLGFSTDWCNFFVIMSIVIPFEIVGYILLYMTNMSFNFLFYKE